MGITVTSNLALIKPDTSESIQQNLPTFNGWAAQNGANMDVVDGLFRGSTHTYSPIWASSGSPTLGAGGFVEGKYVRLQPRMVFAYVRIFAGGAGFNPGSGVYFVSLPVAAAVELNTFTQELPIGRACFFDASAAATCTAFTVGYLNSLSLIFRTPNQDVWGATLPVVMAQNDYMSCYFMYPTSAP